MKINKYCIAISTLILALTSTASLASLSESSLICYDGDEILLEEYNAEPALILEEFPEAEIVKERQRRNGLGTIYKLINPKIRCVYKVKPQLVCRADGQVIFSSENADISAFRAEERGFKVVNERVNADKQAVIYTLEPGNIRCRSAQ